MIDSGTGSTPQGLDALFILATLAVGGTETKVVRLADQLKRRGRRVAIAHLGAPDILRSSIPSDIPVVNLDRRGKFSARALTRLRQLLIKERPATVFIAQLYCLLYVQLAVMLAPETSCRRIAMINTSTFVRTRDRVFMLLYAPILRRMSEMVFGSIGQKELWLRQYDLPRERASVIHNGVDVDRFSGFKASHDARDLRSTIGIPATCTVVGTVGRLAQEKNQIVLVDLLKQLIDSGIDAWLLLVGDGPCRDAIKARSEALGVRDRLRMTGLVQDVRSVLMCMDVFVLPSSSVETLSNAALEAMAMGVPVVLSDVGGASEIVRHGIDGFVYASGDERDLFARTQILCTDQVVRASMGMSCHGRVREKFAIEKMIDEYDRRIVEPFRGGMPDARG